MLFAYDPRARYLSGLGAPRRRRRGLGDAIATDDSPLPTTLTPPPSTVPVIPSQPWVIFQAPTPTQDSPLPTTLTPPAGSSSKPSSSLPATILDAAGNVIRTANLTAPNTSFMQQQLIPGISNLVLFAGLGGIVALALLGGGKKRR